MINFIKNKDDKIWWVERIYIMEDGSHSMAKGEYLFSFDKENPYWADFFKDRK